MLRIKNLIFILFISANIFSQQNLSLSEAIIKSLENNYQVQISELNLEIAKNNNSWGQAGRYPSLAFSLAQTNRFDDAPSQTGTGNDQYSSNMIMPGIQLNWILFNGFSISLNKKNLQLLEDMTEENFSIVVENTIQAVVLAYYNVLVENEKLDILQEVKSLSKDRYDYLLAKKELGNSVTYEVLQAKNSFLSDSSNVLLQSLNLKNAKMNLNLLLGESIETNYSLTNNLEIPTEDYEISDLTSKMFANNKNLRNQYINQKILRNNISLKKSSLYPTISLSSGYDRLNSAIKYEGLDRMTSNSYDYYANFALSYNLFNGGNVKRAIKNARIEQEIGDIQLEEIKNSLSIQLINTFEFYNIRKQLYLVSEESMKAAELNLQISNEKFKSGAINSFNFRDVQLIYQNTAINKLEAIYNLIDSKTELLRLTSGIISVYK
ncbi:MAG: TolC family protein [Bacteroidetes bacterium]|jgi:outer membrane protein|nr:TolC family protein [Bacteroidota bacterium]MBT6684992.1 TolC family protein [Bacteroidota bacterium]MBT7143070.1 TolC family protein [Bacteroidota bacterium]MBT7491517.1 TolC family protein [Bacteroidota bacterium]